MKNSIITSVLLLLYIAGSSQNSKFVYVGRLTPSVKKAQLAEANFVNEIMPEFSRYFVLPFNDHDQFDRRMITLYPQNYFYPQENYTYLFNYVSIEISTTSDGKVLTSESTSETLTAEQKNLLNSADIGAGIHIKIKFKFKNEVNNKLENAGKIYEGEYIATVIPETEAEYPGGFKQFSEYLTDNVFNKISGSSASMLIQQAVLNFTVNEEGQIVDARLLRTSTDPKVDELLLEATNKMPKWMPAENAMGIKVKQEFSIPFGGGC